MGAGHWRQKREVDWCRLIRSKNQDAGNGGEDPRWLSVTHPSLGEPLPDLTSSLQNMKLSCPRFHQGGREACGGRR